MYRIGLSMFKSEIVMDLVMLEFRVQDDSKEWYGELSNSFAFFNGFLD